MSEVTLDLRHVAKIDAYAELQAHCVAVLEGIDDDVAKMATVSCLVHNAFGHLWTGFYRVVDPGTLLRVGPYQGTLGCLEIRFGKGVCGTAAAERRTGGRATRARRKPRLSRTSCQTDSARRMASAGVMRLKESA